MRVCAAILRGDTILMVRHVHDGRDYWTLPGGGVQPGETPEQACAREVLEEVCVTGRVGACLYVLENEMCFAVEIADEPRLGCDPELPADAQLLVGIAWRTVGDLRDDPQVARLLP